MDPVSPAAWRKACSSSGTARRDRPRPGRSAARRATPAGCDEATEPRYRCRTARKCRHRPAPADQPEHGPPRSAGADLAFRDAAASPHRRRSRPARRTAAFAIGPSGKRPLGEQTVGGDDVTLGIDHRRQDSCAAARRSPTVRRALAATAPANGSGADVTKAPQQQIVLRADALDLDRARPRRGSRFRPRSRRRLATPSTGRAASPRAHHPRPPDFERRPGASEPLAIGGVDDEQRTLARSVSATGSRLKPSADPTSE